MDDIDQLLSETEQDANEISAIAIQLVNKFGNNQTLLGFIAEANRVRDRVNRQRLQHQRLNQQSASVDRGARLQILRAEVNQTRIEVSRTRSLIEELDTKMTKKQMTAEQEAKLKQALELMKSANRRLDRIEQITEELLAEQGNCSPNATT